jgi:hypothetical protein
MTSKDPASPSDTILANSSNWGEGRGLLHSRVDKERNDYEVI